MTRRNVICLPSGLKRQHFNGDGTEKRRWPNRDAALLVAALTERRRGKRPRTYRCFLCQGWHNGRPGDPNRGYYRRMPERRQDMLIEVDYRVWAQMSYESRGTPSRRLQEIWRRMAAAQERDH